MGKGMLAVGVLAVMAAGLLGANCGQNGNINQTQTGKVYFPVTNDVIRQFLQKKGVKFGEEKGAFFYKSAQNALIVLQFFDKQKVIYIAMPQIYKLPLEGQGSDITMPMLTACMAINNALLMGKVEWDIESGNVHFGVTLPVDHGITYEEQDKYLAYVETKGIEVIKALKNLEKELRQSGGSEPRPITPQGDWR